MAQIGSDQFTGTPGDSLSAYNPNWVQVTGTSGVFAISADGGRTHMTSAGGTGAYFRADLVAPSADYSVSAEITFGTLPSGPACGIIGRVSPEANTQYSARFVSTSGGSGTWQLQRIIAGSAATIGSLSGVVSSGIPYTLRLEMIGAAIKVYLDDELIISATDSSITEPGRPGVRGLNALSSRFTLDNFIVDDGITTGGSSYTLAAAQGSYAISGNDVGMRISRRLGASAGQYSLQGNPAGLKVARRLAAAPGAYTIIGNAAQLIKGAAPRAIEAATGSYVITGRPAALKAGRRLRAEAGIYVLVGFAAAAAARPVLNMVARFHVLPRDFNLKTIHFSD